MIEVVYNKKDEEAVTVTNLKLPKNIRQIGSGNDRRKIYIEDYVMSYISEIAARVTKDKVVGVLLGENCMWDNARYLFIKGTIKVRNVQLEEGRIILNEASWAGIYEDIKKYFPTLSILGWFVVLEDAKSLPTGSLEKTHVDNFAGNEKTLFLFETENSEQGFYFYENGQLVKEDGYYIYYERNEDMQEYMIGHERKEVAPIVQEIVKEKTERLSSSKLLTFMYSVSTFLVVVVIVMAVNIMNSYEKLSNMQQGIDSIESRVVMVQGQVTNNMANQTTAKTTVSSQNVISQSTSGTGENTSSSTTARTTEASQTTNRTTAENTMEASRTTTAPTTTEPTKPAIHAGKSVHVVSAGESLAIISRMYYGDENHVNEIMEANNITNPDRIYLGQILELP